MGCFYLLTKRLQDIMEKNSDEINFEELDNIENRFHAMVYLAKVYGRISTVPLTASDYKNIYNILYVICFPNFGLTLESKRVSVAKSYIKDIKEGRTALETLISELLKDNNY